MSWQKCRFACNIRHAVPCTSERTVVKKKIWMCLIQDSNAHPRLPVPHKFSSSRCKDNDAVHTNASLFHVPPWLTKQILVLRNLEASIKDTYLNPANMLLMFFLSSVMLEIIFAIGIEKAHFLGRRCSSHQCPNI